MTGIFVWCTCPITRRAKIWTHCITWAYIIFNYSSAAMSNRNRFLIQKLRHYLNQDGTLNDILLMAGPW